jgi:transcriptional regulator with XRE-family HTH domain
MRSGKLTSNGPAIRAIRQLRGLDLRRLAAATGISESHLGNVENERRDLSPAKLLTVAKVLNVPMSAISGTPVRIVGLVDAA